MSVRAGGAHEVVVLNPSAFAEPLSVESKYWIGFLLADGGIVVDHAGRSIVDLTLKFDDVEHVVKFADFVGVPRDRVHELYCRKGKAISHGAKLRFDGKFLVPRLARYGVVPRKSLIATVHLDLMRDPDFWRGMIDGDGCLSKLLSPWSSKGLAVSLGGSRQVVEAFSDYLQFLTGFKPAVSRCRSVFQTRLYNLRACVAVNTIYYGGCTPALERKLQLAEMFKLRELDKNVRNLGYFGLGNNSVPAVLPSIQ